jgi:GTPase SAR1 family protein
VCVCVCVVRVAHLVPFTSSSGAKPKDDVIRIVMAGPQCGKSCLVTRLRFNEFVEVEDPTIRTPGHARSTPPPISLCCTQ